MGRLFWGECWLRKSSLNEVLKNFVMQFKLFSCMYKNLEWIQDSLKKIRSYKSVLVTQFLSHICIIIGTLLWFEELLHHHIRKQLNWSLLYPSILKPNIVIIEFYLLSYVPVLRIFIFLRRVILHCLNFCELTYGAATVQIPKTLPELLNSYKVIIYLKNLLLSYPDASSDWVSSCAVNRQNPSPLAVS